MIRRPFVTIEGQFLSVITVINMLHFLNQLIVYSGGFRGGVRGVRPPKIRKAYVIQR
jgi:hypothetical protein